MSVSSIVDSGIGPGTAIRRFLTLGYDRGFPPSPPNPPQPEIIAVYPNIAYQTILEIIAPP